MIRGGGGEEEGEDEDEDDELGVYFVSTTRQLNKDIHTQSCGSPPSPSSLVCCVRLWTHTHHRHTHTHNDTHTHTHTHTQ